MAESKTVFAMQAVGLAELFAVTFAEQVVAGPVVYRPQLVAPEGPSTAGGKQAVQHIRLVPVVEGAAVVVAGWADRASGKAELRSFAYLAEVHARRFKGEPLPLDKKAYGELFTRMQAFFAQQGLRITVAERPPAEAAPSGPMVAQGPSPARVALVLAVVVAVAAAIAVGVSWALTHSH